jgi:hypothetical protein
MTKDTLYCFWCFTGMLRAQPDCRAGFGPPSTPLTSCSLKADLCFSNITRQPLDCSCLSRVSLVCTITAQGSVVQFGSLYRSWIFVSLKYVSGLLECLGA